MIYQGSKVLLEVHGLCASVNGVEILKDLDFTVRSGEVHAIMGQNGSGKSTFAKVLAGHPAYEVTSGRALFEGRDLFGMKPEERARAGFSWPFNIRSRCPASSIASSCASPTTRFKNSVAWKNSIRWSLTISCAKR